MVTIEAAARDGARLFQVHKSVGLDGTIGEPHAGNLPNHENSAVDPQIDFFAHFEGKTHVTFGHKGRVKPRFILRREAGGFKFRGGFGVPRRSLVGLFVNLGVEVIDGVKPRFFNIAQGVPFHRIGAKNKPAQGWIGPNVEQRVKNSEIGLARLIGSTYHDDAFKTAQRVDKGRTVALLHLSNIVGLNVHVQGCLGYIIVFGGNCLGGPTFSIQNVRQTDSIYVMERLKSISRLR
jgi:hypothetical protein